LGEELETDKDKMRAAGKAAGKETGEGWKEGVIEEDLLGFLVDQVAPRVADALSGGAGVGGGYLE